MCALGGPAPHAPPQARRPPAKMRARACTCVCMTDTHTQHKIEFSAVDLELHGAQQGTRERASLNTRLQAMLASGVSSAGAGVAPPLYLGVLASEGGMGGEERVVLQRSAGVGAIAAGEGSDGQTVGNTFHVRAWAGDTSETVGQERPAGRARLEMQVWVRVCVCVYACVCVCVCLHFWTRAPGATRAA